MPRRTSASARTWAIRLVLPKRRGAYSVALTPVSTASSSAAASRSRPMTSPGPTGRWNTNGFITPSA